MTDVESAGAVQQELKPIVDPREGRDAVLVELRRRWLGPLEGEDEVLSRNPVYAYLVGTLYPVEIGEVEEPPQELVEEVDVDQSITADLTWEQADESESQHGDDPESEDLGVNLTGAFGWAPASLGTSFLHAGSVVRVEVEAGVYESTGEGEQWVRRQLSSTEFIDVSTSGKMLVLDGRANLSWRSRDYRGKKLSTVSLSNAESVPQGEAKRHPELCLFQVTMSCSDDEGILPYPQSDVYATPEDRELSFRFRGRPSFAIGHGVAVDWCPQDAPTTVATRTLPEVEVGALRATVGSGETFRMRWLADDGIPVDELVRKLLTIADDYRVWIADQRHRASAVDGEHHDVAMDIVLRQERALGRIEEGIAVLATNEVVRRSFRLANAAMRWQMLRQKGAIPFTSRYGVRLAEDKGEAEPAWRPFQLGFILSSLASTVDADHEDRERVDLIWFPTGGGKTEAYLGLAAMEMIRRRIARGVHGGGVAVLTRYTMRLLTAQQFQRAATLICALELMRQDDVELDGVPAFSIGLWLGNSTTPGTFRQAKRQMNEIRQQNRPENPFQLLECPWCGHPIMPKRQTRKPRAYGVDASANGFSFFCPDEDCPFASALPVQVVDEGIYENPPTMLVATVDKFARLAWIDAGARLFGIDSVCDSPSLVIQDELHLLSGPLGTIVGVYEAAIGALLRWKGTAPKVIASTATTRASARQARELMAKAVESFPPPGLDADENHFSEPDPDAAGRRYLGIMPQAHTPSWAVGQLAAELLNAPVAVGLSGEALDRYWTLAIYHNSLRELGRTVTILRDDVPGTLARRELTDGIAREIGSDGVHELNGNVPSDELVSLLRRLSLGPEDPQVIDALATTNIMSVGIDVQRLGVMLVNGHTKTTAEYIQATSRVGRGKTPGLVVTMFRSGKPRDRSVFESFAAYHHSYYRFVEPSSVAPWSLQARRRALRAALVMLVRHGVGLNANDDAAMFDPSSAKVTKAVTLLKAHVAIADRRELQRVSDEIDDIVSDWLRIRDRVSESGGALRYRSKNPEERLLKEFTQPGSGWPIMNSMRNVDKVVKVRANGERHA